MTIFRAPAGLKNPHLQTMLPRFIRRRNCFEPVTERLELPDGDFVDLAWSEDPADTAQSKPLFILFHGLEGSFDSPYANGLMDAFARQGWLSVMMHFRGCSGEPNRMARAYHCGETEDARFFLNTLAERFPGRTKVATGISLGGNMLVNYLARYRDEPLLDAATIVSAPLEMAACARRIDQGFSRVYRDYLLGSLKRNALRKLPLLEQTLPLSAERIQAIRRLAEFDDLITARLHGFDDADDYYRRCSGLARLREVSLPLQVIHAKDDPFMTDEVIPRFALPENIDYQLLERGGHVGFVTGTLWRPRLWLEEALPAYYASIER